MIIVTTNKVVFYSQIVFRLYAYKLRLPFLQAVRPPPARNHYVSIPWSRPVYAMTNGRGTVFTNNNVFVTRQYWNTGVREKHVRFRRTDIFATIVFTYGAPITRRRTRDDIYI